MQPLTPQETERLRKVVDCQWACPAHTPVPQYIRLVAERRHGEAYMLNWWSNVFPGVLGRTCDRPCEPACRRGRVDAEPVAICRLKRVAADHKGDVAALMPKPAAAGNGRRVALVGAGPASLTVARDLAPLGYECVLFDADPAAGGMMRTRIPQFRVPVSVIDEEVGQVLALGVELRAGVRIESLRALLDEGWDAVFIGAGAPRGLDLALPGRAEAAGGIHLGVEWLANLWFGHVRHVARRVVVIGGGNTAVDCARSARRLGGEDVTVVVRGPLAEMRAAPSERDELAREGVRVVGNRVPAAFIHENGRLTGVAFQPVQAVYEDGRRRLVPTGEALEIIACDEAVIAIGQEPAFPWIERELGIAFGASGLPVVDAETMASTHPNVFFGGDAAFGARNIISAVANGHAAAISIDALCTGRPVSARPEPVVHLEPKPPRRGLPQLRPPVSAEARQSTPHQPVALALAALDTEVELGLSEEQALAEAARCLNCDVQTVFTPPLCVECNACVSHCPTDCITFTALGDPGTLRTRLRAPAPNPDQDLYMGTGLVSGRVMVKNEDHCLHCGLCADHCPTGAWQMQALLVDLPLAGGHHG